MGNLVSQHILEEISLSHKIKRQGNIFEDLRPCMTGAQTYSCSSCPAGQVSGEGSSFCYTKDCRYVEKVQNRFKHIQCMTFLLLNLMPNNPFKNGYIKRKCRFTVGATVRDLYQCWDSNTFYGVLQEDCSTQVGKFMKMLR